MLALDVLLAAGAALYFEQTVVTYADGRATGPGVVSRVWFAGERMRMEAGLAPESPAFILRLDRHKAYRVDPVARTVTEIDADALRSQAQMDLSMAGDLMGASEDSRVRATNLPPKTIAGYPCQGFRLSAGATRLEVYTTRSLPLGIDAFAEFLEWSGAEQALGPLLAEIRKLPGFPLETHSSVSVLGRVHETLSTVTRVDLAPPAPALFEPPAGYRTLAAEPPEP